MKASLANAIAAYAEAAKALGSSGVEARPEPKESAFAALLKETGAEAVATGRAGEQASLAAVAGKAELSEVVTAVSNAEVTLQTVVAIRDRVIQAYQDILRMPI